MRLLTLNMNMFNLTVDDSFFSYLNLIFPDIAFIQECRYNRIVKNCEKYKIEWAGDYKEPIDSRIHLTAAFSPNKKIEKIDVAPLSMYDYSCIFIKCNGYTFAGVHLPLFVENKENEHECDEIKSKIINSKSKIICGDFNAWANNSNQEFLNSLLNSNSYIDLWQVGLEQEKAFYIDFAGKIRKADKKKHCKIRTFVGNTHIDYILANKAFLNLNEIIIDFRTLAFTDHCGIILNFDINQERQENISLLE